MTNSELTPGTGKYLRRLCGVYNVLNRKWEPHILAALTEGPMRHAELLHAIQAMILAGNWAPRPCRPISDKVLRETLEAMQHIGLVVKWQDPPTTTTISYALTPAATKLMYALLPAVDWADAHPDEVEAATPKP